MILLYKIPGSMKDTYGVFLGPPFVNIDTPAPLEVVVFSLALLL